MTERRFTVTFEHLELLRHANVTWNGDEWGAATVDPKRPYGNGDVLRDTFGILQAAILGGDGRWDHDHDLPVAMTPEQWAVEAERLGRLHRETETVLQIALATGLFEEGVYEAGMYGRNWERVD